MKKSHSDPKQQEIGADIANSDFLNIQIKENMEALDLEGGSHQIFVVVICHCLDLTVYLKFPYFLMCNFLVYSTGFFHYYYSLQPWTHSSREKFMVLLMIAPQGHHVYLSESLELTAESSSV